MTIESRLKQIVIDCFDVKSEEITPEMHFADYDGSMEIVEMLIACEQEFGIEISDDEAQAIRTFQDMVYFLTSKVSSG